MSGLIQPPQRPPRHVIQIDVAENEQVVLLTTGNGDEVVMLTDRFVGNLPDRTPIERSVWAARLRAMADLIEKGPAS